MRGLPVTYARVVLQKEAVLGQAQCRCARPGQWPLGEVTSRRAYQRYARYSHRTGQFTNSVMGCLRCPPAGASQGHHSHPFVPAPLPSFTSSTEDVQAAPGNTCLSTSAVQRGRELACAYRTDRPLGRRTAPRGGLSAASEIPLPHHSPPVVPGKRYNRWPTPGV